jgi:hypothetical protein
MKRDMNLIRAVLIETEKLPDDGAFHDIAVEGLTGAVISNHVRLCAEAGLIDAQDLTTMDRVCWKPKATSSWRPFEATRFGRGRRP